MTGAKENSEFCFPLTLNVPVGIEGPRETKLTVSKGGSH